MVYFWLFLFGLVVGSVSGLLGIGGGVLLVPGLMLLFGFSQPEAQGTSLAVLIPPIGIFAALVYIQHDYVKLPVAAWIALGFAVGALLGAKLVPHVSPEVLRVSFGALLLYLGFSFVFASGSPRPHTALPAGVATLAAWLIAKTRRRPPKSDRSPPQSPSDDLEYQI